MSSPTSLRRCSVLENCMRSQTCRTTATFLPSYYNKRLEFLLAKQHQTRYDHSTALLCSPVIRNRPFKIEVQSSSFFAPSWFRSAVIHRSHMSSSTLCFALHTVRYRSSCRSTAKVSLTCNLLSLQFCLLSWTSPCGGSQSDSTLSGFWIWLGYRPLET